MSDVQITVGFEAQSTALDNALKQLDKKLDDTQKKSMNIQLGNTENLSEQIREIDKMAKVVSVDLTKLFANAVDTNGQFNPAPIRKYYEEFKRVYDYVTDRKLEGTIGRKKNLSPTAITALQKAIKESENQGLTADQGELKFRDTLDSIYGNTRIPELGRVIKPLEKIDKTLGDINVNVSKITPNIESMANTLSKGIDISNFEKLNSVLESVQSNMEGVTKTEKQLEQQTEGKVTGSIKGKAEVQTKAKNKTKTSTSPSSKSALNKDVYKMLVGEEGMLDAMFNSPFFEGLVGFNDNTWGKPKRPRGVKKDEYSSQEYFNDLLDDFITWLQRDATDKLRSRSDRQAIQQLIQQGANSLGAEGEGFKNIDISSKEGVQSFLNKYKVNGSDDDYSAQQKMNQFFQVLLQVRSAIINQVFGANTPNAKKASLIDMVATGGEKSPEELGNKLQEQFNNEQKKRNQYFNLEQEVIKFRSDPSHQQINDQTKKDALELVKKQVESKEEGSLRSNGAKDLTQGIQTIIKLANGKSQKEITEFWNNILSQTKTGKGIEVASSNKRGETTGLYRLLEQNEQNLDQLAKGAFGNKDSQSYKKYMDTMTEMEKALNIAQQTFGEEGKDEYQELVDRYNDFKKSLVEKVNQAVQNIVVALQQIDTLDVDGAKSPSDLWRIQTSTTAGKDKKTRLNYDFARLENDPFIGNQIKENENGKVPSFLSTISQSDLDQKDAEWKKRKEIRDQKTEAYSAYLTLGAGVHSSEKDIHAKAQTLVERLQTYQILAEKLKGSLEAASQGNTDKTIEDPTAVFNMLLGKEGARTSLYESIQQLTGRNQSNKNHWLFKNGGDPGKFIALDEFQKESITPDQDKVIQDVAKLMHDRLMGKDVEIDDSSLQAVIKMLETNIEGISKVFERLDKAALPAVKERERAKVEQQAKEEEEARKKAEEKARREKIQKAELERIQAEQDKKNKENKSAEENQPAQPSKQEEKPDQKLEGEKKEPATESSKEKLKEEPAKTEDKDEKKEEMSSTKLKRKSKIVAIVNPENSQSYKPSQDQKLPQETPPKHKEDQKDKPSGQQQITSQDHKQDHKSNQESTGDSNQAQNIDSKDKKPKFGLTAAGRATAAHATTLSNVTVNTMDVKAGTVSINGTKVMDNATEASEEGNATPLNKEESKKDETKLGDAHESKSSEGDSSSTPEHKEHTNVEDVKRPKSAKVSTIKDELAWLQKKQSQYEKGSDEFKKVTSVGVALKKAYLLKKKGFTEDSLNQAFSKEKYYSFGSVLDRLGIDASSVQQKLQQGGAEKTGAVFDEIIQKCLEEVETLRKVEAEMQKVGEAGAEAGEQASEGMTKIQTETEQTAQATQDAAQKKVEIEAAEAKRKEEEAKAAREKWYSEHPGTEENDKKLGVVLDKDRDYKTLLGDAKEFGVQISDEAQQAGSILYDRVQDAKQLLKDVSAEGGEKFFHNIRGGKERSAKSTRVAKVVGALYSAASGNNSLFQKTGMLNKKGVTPTYFLSRDAVGKMPTEAELKHLSFGLNHELGVTSKGASDLFQQAANGDVTTWVTKLTEYIAQWDSVFERAGNQLKGKIAQTINNDLLTNLSGEEENAGAYKNREKGALETQRKQLQIQKTQQQAKVQTEAIQETSANAQQAQTDAQQTAQVTQEAAQEVKTADEQVQKENEQTADSYKELANAAKEAAEAEKAQADAGEKAVKIGEEKEEEIKDAIKDKEEKKENSIDDDLVFLDQIKDRYGKDKTNEEYKRAAYLQIALKEAQKFKEKEVGDLPLATAYRQARTKSAQVRYKESYPLSLITAATDWLSTIPNSAVSIKVPEEVAKRGSKNGHAGIPSVFTEVIQQCQEEIEILREVEAEMQKVGEVGAKAGEQASEGMEKIVDSSTNARQKAEEAVGIEPVFDFDEQFWDSLQSNKNFDLRERQKLRAPMEYLNQYWDGTELDSNINLDKLQDLYMGTISKDDHAGNLLVGINQVLQVIDQMQSIRNFLQDGSPSAEKVNQRFNDAIRTLQSHSGVDPLRLNLNSEINDSFLPEPINKIRGILEGTKLWKSITRLKSTTKRRQTDKIDATAVRIINNAVEMLQTLNAYNEDRSGKYNDPVMTDGFEAFYKFGQERYIESGEHDTLRTLQDLFEMFRSSKKGNIQKVLEAADSLSGSLPSFGIIDSDMITDLKTNIQQDFEGLNLNQNQDLNQLDITPILYKYRAWLESFIKIIQNTKHATDDSEKQIKEAQSVIDALSETEIYADESGKIMIVAKGTNDRVEDELYKISNGEKEQEQPKTNEEEQRKEIEAKIRRKKFFKKKFQKTMGDENFDANEQRLIDALPDAEKKELEVGGSTGLTRLLSAYKMIKLAKDGLEEGDDFRTRLGIGMLNGDILSLPHFSIEGLKEFSSDRAEALKEKYVPQLNQMTDNQDYIKNNPEVVADTINSLFTVLRTAVAEATQVYVKAEENVPQKESKSQEISEPVQKNDLDNATDQITQKIEHQQEQQQVQEAQVHAQQETQQQTIQTEETLSPNTDAAINNGEEEGKLAGKSFVEAKEDTIQAEETLPVQEKSEDLIGDSSPISTSVPQIEPETTPELTVKPVFNPEELQKLQETPITIPVKVVPADDSLESLNKTLASLNNLEDIPVNLTMTSESVGQFREMLESIGREADMPINLTMTSETIARLPEMLKSIGNEIDLPINLVPTDHAIESLKGSLESKEGETISVSVTPTLAEGSKSKIQEDIKGTEGGDIEIPVRLKLAEGTLDDIKGQIQGADGTGIPITVNPKLAPEGMASVQQALQGEDNALTVNVNPKLAEGGLGDLQKVLNAADNGLTIDVALKSNKVQLDTSKMAPSDTMIPVQPFVNAKALSRLKEALQKKGEMTNVPVNLTLSQTSISDFAKIISEIGHDAETPVKLKIANLTEIKEQIEGLKKDVIIPIKFHVTTRAQKELSKILNAVKKSANFEIPIKFSYSTAKAKPPRIKLEGHFTKTQLQSALKSISLDPIPIKVTMNKGSLKTLKKQLDTLDEERRDENKEFEDYKKHKAEMEEWKKQKEKAKKKTDGDTNAEYARRIKHLTDTEGTYQGLMARYQSGLILQPASEKRRQDLINERRQFMRDYPGVLDKNGKFIEVTGENDTPEVAKAKQDRNTLMDQFVTNDQRTENINRVKKAKEALDRRKRQLDNIQLKNVVGDQKDQDEFRNRYINANVRQDLARQALENVDFNGDSTQIEEVIQQIKSLDNQVEQLTQSYQSLQKASVSAGNAAVAIFRNDLKTALDNDSILSRVKNGDNLSDLEYFQEVNEALKTGNLNGKQFEEAQNRLAGYHIDQLDGDDLQSEQLRKLLGQVRQVLDFKATGTKGFDNDYLQSMENLRNNVYDYWQQRTTVANNSNASADDLQVIKDKEEALRNTSAKLMEQQEKLSNAFTSEAEKKTFLDQIDRALEELKGKSGDVSQLTKNLKSLRTAVQTDNINVGDLESVSEEFAKPNGMYAGLNIKTPKGLSSDIKDYAEAIKEYRSLIYKQNQGFNLTTNEKGRLGLLNKKEFDEAKTLPYIIKQYQRLDELINKVRTDEQTGGNEFGQTLTSAVNSFDAKLKSSDLTNIYTSQLDNMQARVQKLYESLKVAPENIIDLQGFDNSFQNVINQITEVREQLSNTEKDLASKDGDTITDSVKQMNNAVEELQKTVNDFSSSDTLNKNLRADAEDILSLREDIAKYMNDNPAMTLSQRNRGKEMQGLLQGGIELDMDGSIQSIKMTEAEVINLQKRFQSLKTEVEETGHTGNTFFGELGERFKNLGQYLLSFVGFQEVMDQLRQGFELIHEFDDALAEMQKVSNETLDTLRNYQKTTFDTANSVGTTALALQQSTADWMRLGESLQDASESAVTANVLKNISEFTDIGEATTALTAMSAAYANEETGFSKMDIVDKLNKIGNDFSISTDQLATALQDSASSLTTAGNTLDEATALITAGNAITQDPAKVGAGMRTIALRLTGTQSAADALAAAGEDTEGFIGTKSKLRDTIKTASATEGNNYQGVDILDANGNYKSTYKILLELSKQWKDIQATDKKNGTNNSNLLLETIAGKNRSNIAASVLSNPQMLEDVYQESMTAAGSAAAENERYLDSISGHLAKLKNQWDEFWFKAGNREIINFFIDLATAILKVIDTVGPLPSLLGAAFGVGLIHDLMTGKGLILDIMDLFVKFGGMITETKNKGIGGAISDMITNITDPEEGLFKGKGEFDKEWEAYKQAVGYKSKKNAEKEKEVKVGKETNLKQQTEQMAQDVGQETGAQVGNLVGNIVDETSQQVVEESNEQVAKILSEKELLSPDFLATISTEDIEKEIKVRNQRWEKRWTEAKRRIDENPDLDFNSFSDRDKILRQIGAEKEYSGPIGINDLQTELNRRNTINIKEEGEVVGEVTEQFKKSAEAQKEFAEGTTEVGKAVGDVVKTGENAAETIENVTGSVENITDAVGDSKGITAVAEEGAETAQALAITGKAAKEGATGIVAFGGAAEGAGASLGALLGPLVIIPAVIAGVTWGIGKLTSHAKEIKEQASEARDEIQELSNDLQSQRSFMNTNNAEGELGQYFQYRNYVNPNTNENQYLTNDQYSEFLETNNKIAELFPSLVRGYDTNGNAILNLGNNAKTATHQLNELYEANRKVADQQIADKLEDLMPQFNADMEKAHLAYKGTRLNDKNYRVLNQIFSNPEMIKTLAQSGQFTASDLGTDVDFATLQNVIKKVNKKGRKKGWGEIDYDNRSGVYRLTGSDQEALMESIASVIKEMRSDNTANTAQAKQDMETAIAEITPSLNAWMRSKSFYNATSDTEIQSLMSGLLSSSDWYTAMTSGKNKKKYDATNMGDIKKFLQSSYFKPLNNLTSITNQDTLDKYKADLNSVMSPEGMKITDLEKSWKSLNKLFGKTPDFLKSYSKSFDTVQDKLNEIKASSRFQNGKIALDDGDIVNANDAIADLTYSQAEMFIQAADGASTAQEAWNNYTNAMFDADQQAAQNLIDLEAESTGFNNLVTAITDASSAIGMSTADMDNLIQRYSNLADLDLSNYDWSGVFEYTADGVRLNANELNKLESVYEDIQKKAIVTQLQKQQELYQKAVKEGNTEQIKSIQETIDSLQKQKSQFDGLTSSYNKWTQAQSTTNPGTNYDKLREYWDTAKSMFDAQEVGMDDFRTYVDALSGEDLRTASTQEIIDAWNSLDDAITATGKDGAKIATGHSIKDFLAEGTNGAINFLESLNKIDQSWAHLDDNGDWVGTIRENDVAKSLNVDVSLVDAMVQKLKDFGFNLKVLPDAVDQSVTELAENIDKEKQELEENRIKVPVEYDFSTDEIQKAGADKLNSMVSKLKKYQKSILDSGQASQRGSELTYIADQLMLIAKRKDEINTKPVTLNVKDADQNVQELMLRVSNYSDALTTVRQENSIQLDTGDAQKQVDALKQDLEGLSETDLNTIIDQLSKLDGFDTDKLGNTTQEKVDYITKYLNEHPLELDTVINADNADKMANQLAKSIQKALNGIELTFTVGGKKTTLTVNAPQETQSSTNKPQQSTSKPQTASPIASTPYQTLQHLGYVNLNGNVLKPNGRTSFRTDTSSILNYTSQHGRNNISTQSYNPAAPLSSNTFSGMRTGNGASNSKGKSTGKSKPDTSWWNKFVNFLTKPNSSDKGFSAMSARADVGFFGTKQKPSWLAQQLPKNLQAMLGIKVDPVSANQAGKDAAKTASTSAQQSPVDLKSKADQNSASTSGKKITETAQKNAPSVKLGSKGDKKGAEKTGSEISESAQEGASPITLSSESDSTSASEAGKKASADASQGAPAIKLTAQLAQGTDPSTFFNNLNNMKPQTKKVGVTADTSKAQSDINNIKGGTASVTASVNQSSLKAVQSAVNGLKGSGTVVFRPSYKSVTKYQKAKHTGSGTISFKASHSKVDAYQNKKHNGSGTIKFKFTKSDPSGISKLPSKKDLYWTIHVSATGVGFLTGTALTGYTIKKTSKAGTTVLNHVDKVRQKNATDKAKADKAKSEKGAKKDTSSKKTSSAKKESKKGGKKKKGSADLLGTAYASGNWGTTDSGTALVGELGPELVVRGSQFFTVGDDSAEFFSYKKGDVVFNAAQTEQIFEKGKITSGRKRATAYVNGTAFATGYRGHITRTSNESGVNTSSSRSNSGSKGSGSSASKSSGSSASKGSGSSASKGGSSKGSTNSKGGSSKGSTNSKGGSGSGSSSSNQTKNYLDEIEIRINRINTAIEDLGKNVSNTFNTWKVRNDSVASQLNKINEQISFESQAVNKYKAYANQVGLSADMTKKIREGALNIDTITDDKLQEKASRYQELYEKALSAQSALIDLRQQQAQTYQTLFENYQNESEQVNALNDAYSALYSNFVSLEQAKGHAVGRMSLDMQNLFNEQKYNELIKERNKLVTQLNRAMQRGAVKQGTEAWNTMKQAIEGVNASIIEVQTNIQETNNTIRQNMEELWDFGHELTGNFVAQADFLHDLLGDTDDFYIHGKTDDELPIKGSGQLSNLGKTAMALNAIKYETYTQQAETYRKEVANLYAELVKDPYNETLRKEYEERLTSQQEAIKNAFEERKAIRDLIKNGYDKQIDALSETINKYKDLLEAQQNQRQYAEDMADKQKELLKLQRQYQALQGNNTEEGKAKKQQLRESIKQSQKDIRDTQESQRISNIGTVLDNLLTKYQDVLEQKLNALNTELVKTTEGLTNINTSIGAIGNDGSPLANTIKQAINAVNGQDSDTFKKTASEILNQVGFKDQTITGLNKVLNDNNTNLVSGISGIKQGVDSISTILKNINDWVTREGAQARMRAASNVAKTTSKASTQNINGQTWHFNSDGTAKRWNKEGNKEYLLNEGGGKLKGFQDVGGLKYYTDEQTGEKVSNRTIRIGNQDWYFDKNGVGKKVSGTLNYTQAKNVQEASQKAKAAHKAMTFSIGKDIYRFDKNGKAYSGFYQKQNGDYNYFDKNGKLVTNKWVTDPKTGKQYYFGNAAEGNLRGSQTLFSGGNYFFEDDGSRATNKEINGKWYNENGLQEDKALYDKRMAVKKSGKAQRISHNGKLYMINANGSYYTGWNGKQGTTDEYYFDGFRGALKNGLYRVGNVYYHFDSAGHKAMNKAVKVNGQMRVFNQYGVMLTNGWKKVGGKEYYVDKNGVGYTGYKKIGQFHYFFDGNGVKQFNKNINVGNVQRHFRADGVEDQYYDSKTKKWIKGFAKGTKRVGYNGNAWTRENGLDEAIIRRTDGAILTPLKPSDGVLSNADMSNLWEAARNPKNFIAEHLMPNLIPTANTTTTTNNTSDSNVNMVFNLPNVTNTTEFVNALQKDKRFEKLVQEMTLGRTLNHGSLRKYAI